MAPGRPEEPLAYLIGLIMEGRGIVSTKLA